MSTRKIRNTWWVDFYHESRRYRRKSPENSRAGAKAYEFVLRQRLARGEDLTKPKEPEKRIPTFREFSETWFTTYVIVNNKPSEQQTKIFTFKKHLVPFFGKMPLDKIMNKHIEIYKSKKQQEGLSAKSINNHLTMLGKCLRMANEWEELEKIPRIKFLRVPPQRYTFLSIEESEQLLQAADGMWYAMILVALRTGLRLGELRALDWEDIDLEKRLLTVRRAMARKIISSPKSNKIRYIPLTDDVCKILNRQANRKGLVFVNKESRPLSEKHALNTLHRCCKKAGLREIGWHALRHTFASHLAMAPAPIQDIQKLLGHSDIKTTMRYAHLSLSALQRTINHLQPVKE